MRVALIHDALVNKGGAERVFQIFCEMFPDAKIYTSVYLPDKTWPYFKTREIITTPLQKIVKNEIQLKILFPLANYFMSQLKIVKADLILSSSTFCAKYINKGTAKHFCYCYLPFRFLWYPNAYYSNKWIRVTLKLINPVIPLLKKWDYSVAQNIDQFLAMTKDTEKKIRDVYNKISIIISPPIIPRPYKSHYSKESHFLVVSRLEPYKKVDLVVEAFNILKLPLHIVGSGSMVSNLKKSAGQNINFHHNISDNKLNDLYAKSYAVIFPHKCEYGLVPLESNAMGKPAICYGFGGATETMIAFDGKNNNIATSIFFYEQTVESLIKAVNKFMKVNFKRETLLENARKFDKLSFQNKISKVINIVN